MTQLDFRFKLKEKHYQNKLPSGSIVGIRLDGKAFHTFTKQMGFETPYDEVFMDSMDSVAQHLVSNVIPGSLIAYVQSDEISVLFTNLFQKKGSDLHFGGRTDKILSTTASAATGKFIQNLSQFQSMDVFPVFDARVFVLANIHEVEDYLNWRRADARKNSISMAAQSLYSHKELEGKSTPERHQMLQGTPYEQLPEGFFHGRFILPQKRPETIEYFDRRDCTTKTTEVTRNSWESEPATLEALQGFLEFLGS